MLGATAGRFGEEFLAVLIKELSSTIGLDAIMVACSREPVAQSVDTSVELTSVAFYQNGSYQADLTYQTQGTADQACLLQGSLCLIQGAFKQFPADPRLQQLQAESYLAVSLLNSNNQVIGILNVASQKPIVQPVLAMNLLQLFSYRISAELERQKITQSLLDEIKVNQTQLDSVPALMFMLDQRGNFLRWNRYFYSKFGYRHKDMQKLNIFSAIHLDDHGRVKQAFANALEGKSSSFYINGITQDKEIVPLLVMGEASYYENQAVVVGVALDMTEQQNIEHSLLRSQGRLAQKNSQLALMNTLVQKLHSTHSVKLVAREVVDLLKDIEDGASLLFSVVMLNEKALQVIASSNVRQVALDSRKTFDLEESGSPTVMAVKSGHLEVFPDIANDARLDLSLRQLIAAEGIQSAIVLPLVYKNKALGAITIGFKYESAFLPEELEFYDTIGSSIALALANARQFELLESLATQDNLTGLPNRNALNQDSLAALEQASLNQSFLGLILIDLDRFKEINDTLDHQIGDKLLKLIGPRVTEQIHDPEVRIYRLGGDEFCVLVVDKAEPHIISEIAESIKNAIAEPFVVDGLNLEVSASIGVLASHGDEHSASEMLRCAELAMYHAKSQGGGIAHYLPELDEDTHQRFVIMAEMAEAIRSDALVLHYQPKFDLKTHRIVGCEALVRWQHKKYGLIPPNKFIPLIELTQLIHPLTQWVLRNALKQVAAWRSQNVVVNIAINLSTRNLTDDHFMQQVDELLAEFQVPAQQVEFEVTETALMSNLDRARQQLKAFSDRGIQCSLDDYGTGYSSLSYIKKLPLDVLKIDRSFISLMLEDKADRTIAQSTINLAHNLGLRVIAEGVEDQQTLEELALQGCDMIQGYFISRPVAADEFVILYHQYQ